MHTLNAYMKDLMCGHLCLYIGVNNYTIFWRLVGCIPKGFNSVINKFSRIYPSRDQESHFTEKMQNLQQTLTEERDKVVMNANQQKSMLEESLHHTKSEEQRLRTKLAEAEEVRFFLFCFVSSIYIYLTYPSLKGRTTQPISRFKKSSVVESNENEFGLMLLRLLGMLSSQLEENVTICHGLMVARVFPRAIAIYQMLKQRRSTLGRTRFPALGARSVYKLYNINYPND